MRKIKFTTAAAVIAAVTIMAACRFIAGGAERTNNSQSEISCQQALDRWSRVLLLKAAEAEAGTEDVRGKALVMRLVLNRVASEEFPDSIYPNYFVDIKDFIGSLTLAFDSICSKNRRVNNTYSIDAANKT
ncbi:MAG: cell wall hydrolase [Clostridiales bacterium]|nr:cell wall hydrolase [Clostridiales bacterium]